VARVLRSPIDAVGCALLPASCSLCGSPLPRLCSVPICDSCWVEIQIQSGPQCSRCGDALESLSPPILQVSPPITDNSGANLCRVCRLAPPPFVRAVAYGPYEYRMKEAIHALKYDRLNGAASKLGVMLAVSMSQIVEQAHSEMLVIPVPLHHAKHAQRGFNQARSLAQHAIASLRKTHPSWRLTLASSTLMRHRSTASQAGLTPRQRRLNVRGAFSVSDPAAVKGKPVLLIDDIYTTGATARAASQALIKAGAAAVWIATLARARRIYQNRSGSSAFFRNADSTRDLPGSLPGDVSQLVGMHSSPNQPSF